MISHQVYTHRLPQQILTNLQAEVHHAATGLRVGRVVSPTGNIEPYFVILNIS